MIFDFERISVSAQPMVVSGRLEDGCERNHVWIINGHELVGLLLLPQVLELVDHDIHRTMSGFFVHLLVES